jgi:hypothetical protein
MQGMHEWQMTKGIFCAGQSATSHRLSDQDFSKEELNPDGFGHHQLFPIFRQRGWRSAMHRGKQKTTNSLHRIVQALMKMSRLGNVLRMSARL